MIEFEYMYVNPNTNYATTTTILLCEPVPIRFRGTTGSSLRNLEVSTAYVH